MKKLLLVLLALPFIGFGQQTYVPDNNFEAYLEANWMGNGIPNDDYVNTANINTVTYLAVDNQNIADLTGIEDFTALTDLYCMYNQLTSLDVSGATVLDSLSCNNNQLSSLDVRNGNNTNFVYFSATNNPNLYCIDVDDATWSTANWTVANQNIDPQHYFSNNCSGTTEIQEQTTNKELLKVTDLLGRETKATNQPLFYIYNDGTVEKKVVIE
jgi:Leucine-rich repeat (LRR) protein